LQRRIELPAAAFGSLDEAVGFEIDRLTPFKAEDVISRTKVANVGSNALTCDVTVVPRARIQAAMTWAAAQGIRLDRIYVRGETGEPIYLANLPSKQAGERKSARRWRSPWLLALGAIVFAAAAFSFHLDRQQAILDTYLAEIAKTRTLAAATIASRDRIAHLRAALDEAIVRRRALPLMADLLAETTKRLPDDSWLTEFRLADGRMQYSGYSKSAASLVPVIEASDLFQGARLSAPVTSDARLGRERFSIEAKISPRGGQ